MKREGMVRRAFWGKMEEDQGAPCGLDLARMAERRCR
jgi:hypothetical protein